MRKKIMLEVINLVKKYGPLEVLKSISFEVEQGMVFGFLGPNGAGKSTTMNILTGLIRYDQGAVRIGGRNFQQEKEQLLPSIGYLPENPEFYDFMNAREYLKFIGSLTGFPAVELKKRISELIELVRLKEAAGRRIGGYSRGMKQRLGIAVALLNHPSLLFLDEPTSALDPEGRLELLRLIQLLKTQGMTIFLSTHILNDAERVCDRVAILNHGKIILMEDLADLKRKYLQPIFDLEFEGDCSSLAAELKQRDWVQEIKTQGNQMSVYVRDLHQAQSLLLKELASLDERVTKNPALGGNPLIRFQMRSSNLEDIFIRMVNDQ